MNEHLAFFDPKIKPKKGVIRIRCKADPKLADKNIHRSNGSGILALHYSTIYILYTYMEKDYNVATIILM